MKSKDQILLEEAYQIAVNEAARRTAAGRIGNPDQFPSMQPTPKHFVDSNQEMAKKILSDLFVYFQKQGKQDQFRNYIYPIR